MGKTGQLAFRLQELRAKLGISQEEVAAGIARVAYEADGKQVGVNAMMVSKWERGFAHPCRRYQRLLCKFYGVSRTELGLAPDDRTTSSKVQPSLASANTNGLQVDRKTAILVGGSVVLGAAIPWISDGPVGSMPVDLDALEHSVDVFRAWDDRFGGAQKRKEVLAQLADVTDLLTAAHPPETTRRLFRISAHLAKIAATMAWDSGLQNPARHYYRVALYNAKAAQDHSLAANIVAGMARQLLYLGHTSEALRMIQTALHEGRGQLLASVTSMLHVREAWAYADSGDVSGFRRATKDASIALTSDGRPSELGWTPSFDRAELLGTTGGRLLGLARRTGDSRFAAEAARTIRESACLRRSESGRSRTLDQLGLAETAFLLQNLEEGAAIGNAALDVAERTQSDRVRMKIKRLWETSEPYGAVAVVRDLRERTAMLLSA